MWDCCLGQPLKDKNNKVQKRKIKTASWRVWKTTKEKREMYKTNHIFATAIFPWRHPLFQSTKHRDESKISGCRFKQANGVQEMKNWSSRPPRESKSEIPRSQLTKIITDKWPQHSLYAFPLRDFLTYKPLLCGPNLRGKEKKIVDKEWNTFYQSHSVTERKILKFSVHQGERALINWGAYKRSFLGLKAHQK